MTRTMRVGVIGCGNVTTSYHHPACDSAALGRTVTVPLEGKDHLYLGGALAVERLDMPEWSPVRQQGLFATNRTP